MLPLIVRSQVFDGPISESIPSSVISFSHRRNRAGSAVSFTYFQDEEDFAEWSNEDAVDMDSDAEESSVNGFGAADVESNRGSFVSKRLSQSRDSAEPPLLSRYISAGSYGHDRRPGSRLNQKVYIASEDLTVVFAGFSSSMGGFALYLALCILTGGFAYLLFRWLPRWRVKLIGKATPLGKCQWIAIEVRRLPPGRIWRPYLTRYRINGINSPFTKWAVSPTGDHCPRSLSTPQAIYMTKIVTQRFHACGFLIIDICGSSIIRWKISFH